MLKTLSDEQLLSVAAEYFDPITLTDCYPSKTQYSCPCQYGNTPWSAMSGFGKASPPGLQEYLTGKRAKHAMQHNTAPLFESLPEKAKAMLSPMRKTSTRQAATQQAGTQQPPTQQSSPQHSMIQQGVLFSTPQASFSQQRTNCSQQCGHRCCRRCSRRWRSRKEPSTQQRSCH